MIAARMRKQPILSLLGENWLVMCSRLCMNLLLKATELELGCRAGQKNCLVRLKITRP